MLAGFIMLGQAVGTYRVSEIVDVLPTISATPQLTAALVLILIGAFTKSAQFPFHFWLPNAMAAPTPVSAYLHSATMVKAGVFLMARLWPALAGTEIWFYLVASAGLVTMVMAAWIDAASRARPWKVLPLAAATLAASRLSSKVRRAAASSPLSAST